jgi:hypothetical protein
MELMGIVTYRPNDGMACMFLSFIKKYAPHMISLNGISDASFFN